MRILIVLLFLSGFHLKGQYSNTWIEKNDFFGGKRERGVAFSIDNYGYVCSGVNTSEASLNDLWAYNPVTDLWEQKANLPGAVRRDAVGFSIDGVGYVGLGMDSVLASTSVPLNDLWAYFPENNSWEQKANFPVNGIYFTTAFTADNKAYICGGKFGANEYSNQLWEYKPSNNQWTERANFPGGLRYQLSSFSINNIGYVGLGANQDVFKKDFYKYNPGSNQWTQIQDFPSERGCATAFAINDMGYICLGTNGGLLGDLISYNPELDQWNVKCSYGGSERKSAISFVVDNKAYVGTGKGYSGKKDSMYEYWPTNTLGEDETVTADLKLFPNPTSDILNVIGNNYSVINIYDSQGRFIQSIPFEYEKTSVNLSTLPKGTYFINTISTENKIILE